MAKFVRVFENDTVTDILTFRGKKFYYTMKYPIDDVNVVDERKLFKFQLREVFKDGEYEINEIVDNLHFFFDDSLDDIEDVLEYLNAEE